ncbi:protein-L-isoaspartate O-methyltransferase family protein [Caenispirillum bisanense]|uniref:Protein-L-isoaspartate O-methyltransferase n=1 Tax=Caenispirillum bisanense TaxID=414052 RepID=A0A286H1C9_9PROT|nr:protein-L-isoaspartate O-methyltransferase [Caenispirillum bisanense]SOE01159.1 protein-L-isoaspartate(D-aspartate) O-methyltransferase [Caenispirillum bisanense]
MDFNVARRNMVEGQIRTNRVTDPLVLNALKALPREMFVPKAMQSICYMDEGVPLGGGRALMEPLALARLLQEAAVQNTDAVLVIGAGTGYAAAALAHMASAVVALESDQGLADTASRLMADLGIDNVAVVTGPLDQGYPQQAPYDVIFFDGGVSEIPAAICDQLAEGGRLVAVTEADRIQLGRAVLVTRNEGAVGRRAVFEANVPVLPGFEPDVKFTF